MCDEGHRAGSLHQGHLEGWKLLTPNSRTLPSCFTWEKAAATSAGRRGNRAGGAGKGRSSRPRGVAGTLRRSEDVFFREIVAVGGVGFRLAGLANAALGGDRDVVAHAGDLFECQPNVRSDAPSL